MQAFLDSLGKKTTRYIYKRGIELFVDFCGKSVDEILQERKEDLTPRPKESMVDTRNRASRYERLLENFYAWLGKEGYGQSSKYSYCKGLRQLFR